MKKVPKLIYYWKKYSIPIGLIIIIGGCIESTIQMIISPTYRSSIFGIGWPAPTETLLGENIKFRIQYPQSWAAVENPNIDLQKGGRIAVILAPFRSFPQIFLYTKSFDHGTLDEVADWGKSYKVGNTNYHQVSLSAYQSEYYSGYLREYTWEDVSVILGREKTYIVRCYDWYTLMGNKGYTLALCSDEGNWESIKELFLQTIRYFYVE